MSNDFITVEVAYAASKNEQALVSVKVPANSTIATAIELSQIAYSCSGNLVCGIFGKKVDMNSYQLQQNDRIEIYRPLYKTPMERRKEAQRQQQ